MKKNIAVIAGISTSIIIISALILISNQELDNTDYKPLSKEWQVSGPFQIDRSEYAIGEKIFLVVNGLKVDEKGQINIMRPWNATHQAIWDTIPFMGSQKTEFNFYFEPKISEFGELCSVDDIIGKWSLVFNGTNYKNLDFEINEKVVPGISTEPVC